MTITNDRARSMQPPTPMKKTLEFKTLVLRPFVKMAQSVLPQRVFDITYDALFPIYKSMARFAYYVRAILSGRFRDSEDFAMVKRVHSVMPYSLVGFGGLEVTDWAARAMIADGIEGDYAELGVARGGCAALLAMQIAKSEASPRKLWLFDSYEGLPDPGANDYVDHTNTATGDHIRPLPKGSCRGALEEVQWLLFDKFGLSRDRIEFVKGWFESTVPETAHTLGNLAVLRLDGDWYESTRICLVHLYKKVSDGGVVIIDDYDSCAGSKRAVDEYLAQNGIEVVLNSDGRGGRWFRKH